MHSTCVVCEKDYDVSTSTATNTSADWNYTALYCSNACEAIDLEWLDQGTEILNNAKKNNPQAFIRTNMTIEQTQAMDTFKNLGVKFRGTELKPNPEETEN